MDNVPNGRSSPVFLITYQNITVVVRLAIEPDVLP